MQACGLSRRFVQCVFLVIAGGFLSASAAPGFEAQCRLPFERIKGDNPAVLGCPLEGAAKEESQQAQNRAKNNLCARGNAVDLSFRHFVELQKIAADSKIPFGSHTKVPEDRSVLKDLMAGPGGARLGEGTVVRHVGFVTHPRNSNRSKGEAVNCKRGGIGNNDIHLDLVQSRKDPACRSITAEIIPHFRPAQWEVDVLKMERFMERPMRFTGQLFFDASHRPCHNDKDTINPKRASIWEIHPVYAIDVCKFKTIKSCGSGNDDVWTPLSAMVDVEGDEEDE